MIDIVDRLKFDAVRCEVQFSKGVAGNITEAAAAIERLRLRLRSILEWHQNWDAPFHDEGEWIGDYRLAREELGMVPAAIADEQCQPRGK